MNWSAAIGVGVICALAAGLATGLVRRLMLARAILVHPNERSSHSAPTPPGGGIAVVAVVAAAWLLAPMLGGLGAEAPVGVCLAAVVLAAMSWFDDLRGLGAGIRLVVQAAAVLGVMVWAPLPGPLFQGLLPEPLDSLLSGLLWLWFINLFNFMDGIDGLAAVESVAIGGGVAVALWALPAAMPALGVQGLAVAGAALGFGLWNWHPARIFLGDVGSVPLGFLLGWLLLSLAGTGAWAVALILPLYYLADATITLGRRALRGERLWRPHRQHFYQLAVAGGWSHARVAAAVAVADGLLVAAAVAAARGFAVPAVAVAVAVVGLLLLALARAAHWR